MQFLLLCVLISLMLPGSFCQPHHPDEVEALELFGNNSKYFTVCSSMECCQHTLRLPEHADKLMLYIPTIHVDGDAYLSYYLGLLFDTFVFQQYDGGNTISTHILVLSLSHSMTGGPYMDAYAVQIVRSCNLQDSSFYDCNHFASLLQSTSTPFYHKNLAVVVLNDAVLTPDYCNIAFIYPLLYNSSLFAIIHLNHEQPWLDNQRSSTEDIRAAYRSSRIVFRTHFFSDFIVENVHYLPLGPGLLQTERMALGLKKEHKRFPSLIGSKMLLVSERSWLCSFAGSMKYRNRGNSVESSRAEMVETLQEIPGCIFYPTDDVSESSPLSQDEYFQLTKSTIFSLCPRGVGPETNRPYQALEMGAIPVMVREADQKKDFLVMWKDYPGPIFSSWFEAKSFLYDVILGHISLSAIDELQGELISWFSTFKELQKDYARVSVLEAMSSRDRKNTNYDQ